MAAETEWILHRQHQQRMSTSGVDKEEWNDFNGFEATQCAKDVCGLSEHCANDCLSTDVLDSVPSASATETSCLLHGAIERCFCRSSPEATTNLSTRISSPVYFESQESLVSNSRYEKMGLFLLITPD